MAYRIRYVLRKRDRRWVIGAAVSVFAAAVYGWLHWYDVFARYVGAQIRGAG